MKRLLGREVAETLDEVLSLDSCAVLAIDLQNDAMRSEGKIAQAGNDISPMLEILPRCASFLDQARELGVRVMHTRVVTLPNGWSDSPAWLRLKGAGLGVPDYFLEGSWGGQIVDECAPRAGEAVIDKHRSSAFLGTDLEQLLKANGITALVMLGEQTPGCVEATFRDAVNHDYYAVLLEDCVAAFNCELHAAAMKVLKARQDVSTSAEVLSIWRAQLESGAGRCATASVSSPKNLASLSDDCDVVRGRPPGAG